MGLLEVLDQAVVVGGFLTADRAGVHEVGHRDGFGHGLLRHAEHAADAEPRDPGGNARQAAGLEEVATGHVAHRHTPPPSLLVVVIDALSIRRGRGRRITPKG